jgi:protocatechuate 3,4-dioxygenase beta subunit
MIAEDRLTRITERILSDLRQTVTDFQITEEELHDAARFLDRLGQAGESSDLLDIFLGVTSVVATIGAAGGTTPNLSGPYYKAGAPTRPDGCLLERPLRSDEMALTIHGRVTDVRTGAPVPDAVLDIWQADGNGVYDEQGYDLRGLVAVNEDGTYAFETVFPEGYEIPAKGPTTELLDAIGQQNWRPAHVHLRVHVGDTTPLQTQFFLTGTDFLDCDPVDAVRSDLVIDHRQRSDGEGREADINIELALDSAAPRRSWAVGPKVELGVARAGG